MKKTYILFFTLFMSYTMIAQCEIEATVETFSCEGANIIVSSPEPGLVYELFLNNELVVDATINNVFFVTESGVFTVVATNTMDEMCELVVTVIIPDPPVAVIPAPLVVCDDDNDCITVFDITVTEAEITGGVATLIVSYYETIEEASIGEISFALSSPYTNVVPCIQTIYARVEDPTTGCFTIVPLELIVASAPEVVADPDDLILTDADDDGIEVFDLTVNEAQMLGDQNPAQYVFTYYETEVDCFNGTNTLVDPTAYHNLINPQTVFVQIQDLETGCFVCTSFTLEVTEELGLENTALNNFTVFPNPTTDVLKIDFTRFVNSGSLSIFSLEGKEVLRQPVLSTNNVTLDLQKLNNGVYFLQIISETGKSTQKFIKQ